MTVGYISELGTAVSSLEVGQYVIIPDNGAIGHIDMGVGTAPLTGAPFGGANGGLQGESHQSMAILGAGCLL